MGPKESLENNVLFTEVADVSREDEDRDIVKCIVIFKFLKKRRAFEH